MNGNARYEATIEPSGRRWLVRLHESRKFNGVWRQNPGLSERPGWYCWTQKRARRKAGQLIEKAYGRESQQSEVVVVRRRDFDDPLSGMPGFVSRHVVEHVPAVGTERTAESH